MTSTRRLCVDVALLGCLLAAFFAIDVTPAFAHGGRINPNPTPPPPPPPPEPGLLPPSSNGPRPPPITAAPPTSGPVGMPSTTPSTPPQTGRRPATGPGGRGRGPSAPTASWESTWQTWWNLNRWSFLPDRHSQRVFREAVTPSQHEEHGDIARAKWDKVRDLAASKQIVPYLLELLDPANRLHDEVRSAALIALAKVTKDPMSIEVIFRHAEDAKASPLVRESGALAVGLLRRTSPNHRFEADVMEAVRHRLFTIIDDRSAPTRTRAFAAMSIGLLADQAYDGPFASDGKLTTRDLWNRLGAKYSSQEIPIALMTALRLQPPAGVAETVREGLHDIVTGKRVFRRKWSDDERAHAFSTLVHLGGSRTTPVLLRALTWRQAPQEVRRAAFIALGARAELMTEAERLEAVEAWSKGCRYARDPLSRGLAQLALGRVIGADLRAGNPRFAGRSDLTGRLFKEAKNGVATQRGFGALALALSVYRVPPEHKTTATFINQSRALIMKQLESGRGGAGVRSAFVVALGLVNTHKSTLESTDVLISILEDRNNDPALRGYAAVSLGQMSSRRADILKALKVALWDKRSEELRSEAALALSLLSRKDEGQPLMRELENASTERVLAQVAIALGQLGDLAAVPSVIGAAKSDERSDIGRAFALTSLGLMADPETKPSLLRLSLDANYASLTDALHEAFTIL